MGSLMAGWSTHPNDAQKDLKRSKTSLTKDEIEAYWRQKQRDMEIHLREASAQNALNNTEVTKTTSSTTITPNGQATQKTVIEWQQPTAASHDWWTRSNWAFLNEPPETDFVPHNKHRYATQIDVAARASNLHQLSGRQLNLSPVF